MHSIAHLLALIMSLDCPFNEVFPLALDALHSSADCGAPKSHCTLPLRTAALIILLQCKNAGDFVELKLRLFSMKPLLQHCSTVQQHFDSKLKMWGSSFECA